MADKTRRVEYYYVTVPDRPGEGKKVLSALKESKVNLLAYLGFPSGKGKAQLDLVPENAKALKQAAGKAGIKLSGTKKAFLIQGDDRPGAVADAIAKLADANINVTSAAAAVGGGKYGLVIWVRPADYERAARALGA
jgi:hypothetical protein